MRTFIMKTMFLSLVAVLTLVPASSAQAGERSGDVLVPAIPASEAEDYQTDDDDIAEGESPLEPAMDPSVKKGLRYGTVLEYWFLEPGEKMVQVPADLSLTGMVDDSRQLFSGAAMLRDGELKKYAGRQGILRWTAYFRVTKPGKHVFAVSTVGLDESSTDYSGVALGVNDVVKAKAAADRDGSTVVDFPTPGWYKLQVWLWWSHNRKPSFQDYGVSLKVREPGTLSLRPIARKELYYKLP